MNKLPYFLIALILGAGLVGLFWYMQEPPEEGDLGGSAYSAEKTFFKATTTSVAQYPTQDIENAKKITMFFQRGDTTGVGNTGTSTFSAQVSRNGTDWITYNKLIDNVINSNSQQLTRVASVIFSAAANYDNATGTKAYSMDMENDTYKWLRCLVTEGTDGEHSCYAFMQF